MIYTAYRRVKDAIRFKQYNGNSTWLILGGLTPWDDDEAPPNPDPDVDLVIDDAFIAKKATVQMVKEDPQGIITYTDGEGNDRTFTEVLTAAEMISEVSTFVCLTGVIKNSDLPAITNFRKIGFATDLVPATGYENAALLQQAHVDDWGVLECLQNELPIPKVGAGSYQFRQVLEY